MDFTDLGLESIWSPALATQGIDVPTTIQQRAIPLILQGLDTYVGAETGTGKTLAYLLPLMQRLDASTKSLQVVVLAPTLELALQTHRQAQALAAAAGGYASIPGADRRCVVPTSAGATQKNHT
jgi:ATP-dependent RNA helicase DeaD